MTLHKYYFGILIASVFSSQPLWSQLDTIVVSAPKKVYVSIIDLISNPDKYHNQIVHVVGFLHNKFEDSAIYFSKEDADYLFVHNAIWINYSDSIEMIDHTSPKAKPNKTAYFDCQYVALRGVFNKNSNGHFGMFPGTIENVSSISLLRKWYDGKKDLSK